MQDENHPPKNKDTTCFRPLIKFNFVEFMFLLAREFSGWNVGGQVITITYQLYRLELALYGIMQKY